MKYRVFLEPDEDGCLWQLVRLRQVAFRTVEPGSRQPTTSAKQSKVLEEPSEARPIASRHSCVREPALASPRSYERGFTCSVMVRFPPGVGSPVWTHGAKLWSLVKKFA